MNEVEFGPSKRHYSQEAQRELSHLETFLMKHGVDREIADARIDAIEEAAAWVSAPHDTQDYNAKILELIAQEKEKY